MTKFNQSRYWVDRHDKFKGDPRSVGHLGFSFEENIIGEQVIKKRIVEALRFINLNQGATVLDLGCGCGRITTQLIESGLTYLGVDVSSTAILQAQENEPRGKYIVADLNSWQSESKFDLVCSLYVFVHFVEELAWKSLVLRSLSWVKEGGALLFADRLAQATEHQAEHAVARSRQDYIEAIKGSGFEFDAEFESKKNLPDFFLIRKRK